MQNTNYNTKAVVEAGLISTLIVVIMLANSYIPIFSLIGMFILPIPVTVLYIRHNYKITLGAVIVSSIITFIIQGPLPAFQMIILLATVGITLGYCVKYKKSVKVTLMLVTIATVIEFMLALIILSYIVTKQGIIGFLNQNVIKVMQQSLNMTKEMYTNMGITKEQMTALDDMTKLNNIDFLLKNGFSILFVGGFISACINYFITRAILKKLKYEMEKIKPFTQFYVNSKVAAIIAILLFIGILLNRNKIAIGEAITTFAYFILLMVLLLDGLALASYYLKTKFNMSNLVTNLILIFAVFSKLFVVFAILGFMDILFDFRKVDSNRRPKVE